MNDIKVVNAIAEMHNRLVAHAAGDVRYIGFVNAVGAALTATIINAPRTAESALNTVSLFARDVFNDRAAVFVVVSDAVNELRGAHDVDEGNIVVYSDKCVSIINRVTYDVIRLKRIPE